MNEVAPTGKLSSWFTRSTSSQSHFFRAQKHFQRQRIHVLLKEQAHLLSGEVEQPSSLVMPDVAFYLYEATKVPEQIQLKFAKGLVDGFSQLYATKDCKL
ncbi:hypothetical protein H6P81_004236 [Aristolochia fimbriata]|uniref:Uncharacterized protein n=1 Tax=Aristolochia fimbriata TaxID=158543 RepID=A0AAV7FF02_ARIFI|nr:hypothetical protein H6P81_004236 [Aristolochia fimbriata]